MGIRHVEFGIVPFFSSRSFVVLSRPRCPSVLVFATNPNIPPSRLPSHPCPVALTSAPYCLPAIAGQCPHPIKHIYHARFCPHPTSRFRLAPSGRVSPRARQIIVTGIYYSPIPPLYTFSALSPAMPLPTTPQRLRTSSLKVSHVKVRARFNQRWHVPP